MRLKKIVLVRNNNVLTTYLCDKIVRCVCDSKFGSLLFGGNEMKLWLQNF